MTKIARKSLMSKELCLLCGKGSAKRNVYIALIWAYVEWC